MAEYQIMYWQDVPAQVRVSDATQEVSAELDRRFQEAIDLLAMQEGLMDTDDFLAGWHWGEPQARPGPADEVLAAVLAELDRHYPRQVSEMVEAILDARDHA